MSEFPISNVIEAAAFTEEVKGAIETEIQHIDISMQRIAVAKARLILVNHYLTTLSGKLSDSGLNSNAEKEAAGAALNAAISLNEMRTCADQSTECLKDTIELVEDVVERIEALSE